jgi:hypothetical protein
MWRYGFDYCEQRLETGFCNDISRIELEDILIRRDLALKTLCEVRAQYPSVFGFGIFGKYGV